MKIMKLNSSRNVTFDDGNVEAVMAVYKYKDENRVRNWRYAMPQVE